MLLKLKYFDKNDYLMCELTLDNMNYKLFRDHFVSFTHSQSCRLEIYEIPENSHKETLVAVHTL